VVPSTLDFVTIRVKRRVKVLGLKVVTKDVSYSTTTDLEDVLATCMARVFHNLDILLAYAGSSKRNIPYDAHELFQKDIRLISDAIECRGDARKDDLKLLESLDAPQT
jgi:hypothetical protein